MAPRSEPQVFGCVWWSAEPSGRREESTDDAQRRAIMAMASSVNSGGDGAAPEGKLAPG
jgi:hypothetical protein